MIISTQYRSANIHYPSVQYHHPFNIQASSINPFTIIIPPSSIHNAPSPIYHHHPLTSSHKNLSIQNHHPSHRNPLIIHWWVIKYQHPSIYSQSTIIHSAIHPYIMQHHHPSIIYPYSINHHLFKIHLSFNLFMNMSTQYRPTNYHDPSIHIICSSYHYQIIIIIHPQSLSLIHQPPVYHHLTCHSSFIHPSTIIYS